MSHNPWKHRCWLLVSPRSGSTYLQYLLNQNAGVPIQPHPENLSQARYCFGEHLNQNFCASWEQFCELDPIVSRVHCHQFGRDFTPVRDIVEQFEGIRFIVLERRDEFAHAASLALANATGVTQCTTLAALYDHRQSRVDVTDTELQQCLQAVQHYRSFWRNWLHLESHLVVTYEALAARTIETLKLILDYLEMPSRNIDVHVPLFRLSHPQQPQFALRLRELVHAESGSPAGVLRECAHSESSREGPA